MITIFLNVNIQYLLHFQIDLFLIYLVVIIFPPYKTNKIIKSLVPLRVTTDLCKARTSRRRCITENGESNLSKLFFLFIFLHCIFTLNMM